MASIAFAKSKAKIGKEILTVFDVEKVTASSSLGFAVDMPKALVTAFVVKSLVASSAPGFEMYMLKALVAWLAVTAE
jgi:hypothetical protein